MKLMRQSGQDNMYLINKGFVWVLVILIPMVMIFLGMWINDHAVITGEHLMALKIRNTIKEGIQGKRDFYIKNDDLEMFRFVPLGPAVGVSMVTAGDDRYQGRQL